VTASDNETGEFGLTFNDDGTGNIAVGDRLWTVYFNAHGNSFT